MPTLLRIEGFRFSFFAGDGVEPIHVHVSKGSASAKVWLQPIRELSEEHEAFFVERWNEYFGR